MRLFQDTADRAGSANRDLLPIDGWAKSVQSQIPAFGLGKISESTAFQPTCRPRVRVQDSHQVVPIRDPQLEDARSERADRHASSEPSLTHASDRVRDQLESDSFLIWTWHDAQRVNQARAGTRVFILERDQTPWCASHARSKMDEADRDIVFVDRQQEMLGLEIEFAQDALIPEIHGTA